MKTLVISDIHGNYEDLNNIVNNESFDSIIILGDLFSYGFYDDDKNEIIELLNKYKNKLILIKGNCDIFVNFEAYNLYAYDVLTISIDKHIYTIMHKDNYNLSSNYPSDVILYGHTHVPVLKKERNIVYLNPGSISVPRGGSLKSYMLIDNNKVMLKTIDNIIIKEMNI